MTTQVQHGEETRTVFPALDTLRILGALCVLTTHVAFWTGSYTSHGIWGTVLARLDVGVAIFFVLSGFLLARPWIVSAASQTRGPALPHYYLRRVMRIMPVYLLTAFVALTFISANDAMSPSDWIVTLTLGDIYLNDGPPHGLTHTWSLATEVSFYVVLPALAVALVGRRPRFSARRIGTVLAVAALASILWIVYADDLSRLDYEPPLTQWLPGMFIWFAAGIALATVDVLVRFPLSPPRWARGVVTLGQASGVCWVSAGAILLIASTPLAGPTMLAVPTGAEALTKHLLYAGIGVLLVLPGVFATTTSGFMRIMSHPWLRHFGHISYGVFCLHVPLLHLLYWATDLSPFDGHLLQVWLLTTALSLLAAEVVFRLVERPALRLGRGDRPPAMAIVAESTASTR